MTAPKKTTFPSFPMTTPTETSVRRDLTGWLCIECWESQADADAGVPAEEIHVVPNFGPEHTLSHATCWCHPTRDADDRRIVVHNVAQ